jgi:hypothetical protein
LLEELITVIDDFVENLEGITPPIEAADAHNQTIAGFQAFSGYFTEALEDIELTDSADPLFALFENEEVIATAASLDEACRSLQTLADGQSIDVDLGCE